MKLLDKIEFKATLVGLRNSNTWGDHYLWDVTINKFSIEYRTGTGYAVSDKRRRRNDRAYRQHDFKFVEVPRLGDVLRCLFSDGDIASEFYDYFLATLGCPDTMESLNIYLQCQRNAIGLRKALGTDYEKIKNYIMENEK